MPASSQAPSPSPAHLLQEVNFLLLGVEDGQGLLMLQLQLLPPFCGLSHVLGRQEDTQVRSAQRPAGSRILGPPTASRLPGLTHRLHPRLLPGAAGSAGETLTPTSLPPCEHVFCLTCREHVSAAAGSCAEVSLSSPSLEKSSLCPPRHPQVFCKYQPRCTALTLDRATASSFLLPCN